MAFVRWRGNCAELLATVYENGRSRQILLANLYDTCACLNIRLQVAKEHPDIHVDWFAVDLALARGPKPARTPEPPVTIVQAEALLRGLAQQLMHGDLLTREGVTLLNAADILFSLRAQYPSGEALGKGADLSSADTSQGGGRL